MHLFAGALDQYGGKLEMSFEPMGLVCAIKLNLKDDTPNLVAETDGLKAFPKVNRAPPLF